MSPCVKFAGNRGDHADNSKESSMAERSALDEQLLSIAHRLQTVAYYDRILVMDAGRVAEVR